MSQVDIQSYQGTCISLDFQILEITSFSFLETVQGEPFPYVLLIFSWMCVVHAYAHVFVHCSVYDSRNPAWLPPFPSRVSCRGFLRRKAISGWVCYTITRKASGSGWMAHSCKGGNTVCSGWLHDAGRSCGLYTLLGALGMGVCLLECYWDEF